MANIIDFMSWKSGKSRSRTDRRISEELADIVDKIKELESRVPEDIQKGDVEKTFKDVSDLLNFIIQEERDLEQIEKDSAILDKELLQEVGTISQELQSVQKDSSLQDQIQQLQDLSGRIRKLIDKARIDARNAEGDREKIIKYRAFLGYHQTARDIRHATREIGRLIGKEKELEKHIKNHEKEEEIIKKDVAEFIKVAEQEAKDIYKVEHDDIIFTFFIINKLQNIYNVLLKLKQEGFEKEYPEKQKLLEHKYAEAQQLLQEATTEAYSMEKYLKRKAKKLAA